jgi:hypothetical protein
MARQVGVQVCRQVSRQLKQGKGQACEEPCEVGVQSGGQTGGGWVDRQGVWVARAYGQVGRHADGNAWHVA